MPEKFDETHATLPEGAKTPTKERQEELERLRQQAMKRKRAGDIVSTDQLEVDRMVKMADILDNDFILVDFHIWTGKLGDFAAIELIDIAGKERLGVTCGGAVVMRKLASLAEQRALPCLIKFTQPGRYYDIE